MTNPADPYHAHVYFDADTFPAAKQLHDDLSAMLDDGSTSGLVMLGKMHDRGVGPHPKPSSRCSSSHRHCRASFP